MVEEVEVVGEVEVVEEVEVLWGPAIDVLDAPLAAEGTTLDGLVAEFDELSPPALTSEDP